MDGFKIKALTLKGKAALGSQVKEQQNAPAHARLMMKQLFKIEYGDDSLSMTIRNAFVASAIQPADFVERIKVAFSELGCVQDVDYSVGVF